MNKHEEKRADAAGFELHFLPLGSLNLDKESLEARPPSPSAFSVMNSQRRSQKMKVSFLQQWTLRLFTEERLIPACWLISCICSEHPTFFDPISLFPDKEVNIRQCWVK